VYNLALYFAKDGPPFVGPLRIREGEKATLEQAKAIARAFAEYIWALAEKER
jgi:hypothetical protein